jgi:hypothetical protein
MQHGVPTGLPHAFNGGEHFPLIITIPRKAHSQLPTVGFQDEPVGHAQAENRGGVALLSVKTMAPPPLECPTEQQPTEVRLFVSVVVVLIWQDGGLAAPSWISTLTTSVDPVLKYASKEQQNPKTLNSASVQAVVRSNTLALAKA